MSTITVSNIAMSITVVAPVRERDIRVKKITVVAPVRERDIRVSTVRVVGESREGDIRVKIAVIGERRDNDIGMLRYVAMMVTMVSEIRVRGDTDITMLTPHNGIAMNRIRKIRVRCSIAMSITVVAPVRERDIRVVAPGRDKKIRVSTVRVVGKRRERNIAMKTIRVVGKRRDNDIGMLRYVAMMVTMVSEIRVRGDTDITMLTPHSDIAMNRIRKIRVRCSIAMSITVVAPVREQSIAMKTIRMVGEDRERDIRVKIAVSNIAVGKIREPSTHILYIWCEFGFLLYVERHVPYRELGMWV